FAYKSHVPRYDLIREMSIGPSKRLQTSGVAIRAGHSGFTNGAPTSAAVHVSSVCAGEACFRAPDRDRSATVVPTHSVQVRPGLRTYPMFSRGNLYRFSNAAPRAPATPGVHHDLVQFRRHDPRRASHGSP